MEQQNIQCPNCKHSFPLTDSIAGPMIAAERERSEAKLAELRAEQAKAQEKLVAEQASLAEEKAKMQSQVQDQVKSQLHKQMATERTRIEAQEKERLSAQYELQNQERAQKVALMEERMQAQAAKLSEAQNAQAELLKKSQELDDAKREMALNIQKEVAEKLAQTRAAAVQEAEQKAIVALTEKNEQLAGLQRQIEDLKRRAEQGSQQSQGEALELVLEDTLRTAFLRDAIEPVPKGVNGADVVHRVHLDSGAPAGIILWELKRTKAWSPGWLAKLREDQRTINADISVLVSEALPANITTFGMVDGVWVSSPRYAVSLAYVIRSGIINVALSRKASEGQESKMELVYNYLTGTGFRARVEAIVERFTELSDDLDKEKKFMTRKWAKQEKQLEAVRAATLGLHGDLQGIAGSSVVPELESMDALMLDV